MANINELMEGWGFGKQTAIGTANACAAIWRHTNLNTEPWAKVPVHEDDRGRCRMAKKLARASCPCPPRSSTLMKMLDSGGLLLSAGSAMAPSYSPRPEQKLAHHTEDTEHDDQLPSARPQPEPHVIPGSPDSFLQVIQENEEAQHRCHLVTVRVMVWPDGSLFSWGTVFGEKEPNKPDRYVQSVVAQHHQER